MATDLQPERNALVRLFDTSNRQSILIVLTAIAVLTALIAWGRSERAIDAANSAVANVLVLEDINDRLRDENKQLATAINIAERRVGRLQSTLYARGISIEENDDE